MKRITFLILTAFILLSCDKNSPNSTKKADRVIFGGVYGMCGGDCRELYLLNEKGLFSDANSENDKYGDWKNTTFKSETINYEDQDKLKTILNFPESLMGISDIEVQTWADVDAYLYIERDGVSREFVFDEIDENSPQEIKEYFNALKEFLPQLSNDI
jgi:hypothetical protein